MTGKEITKYKSVRQVAGELGITRQGVDYLIKKGEIDALYVDTFYLIPKAEIEKIKNAKSPKNDKRIKIK